MAKQVHQLLPDAKPLTWQGDLAARMVAGIHKYLDRATAESVGQREGYWKRDLTSWAKYPRSVEPNRRRLAEIIGVVDKRQPPNAELVMPAKQLARLRADPFGTYEGTEIGEGNDFTVHVVRWSVLRGVEAEGLLLEPERAQANTVALPDADWTPEMLCGLSEGLPPGAQYARRLAESGCRVLIPTLINRDCEWSVVRDLKTNQPHREFVYRAAYELGRHVIGYEVQKVLAAVDWFVRSQRSLPVGVMGYGEGGLIALHAAALDQRIRAVAVSGYFGPREGVSGEPIYRNVWGLLQEFGDAEVATLIAPRTLVVEASPAPEVTGPPPVTEGRSGAAPGGLVTPAFKDVENEVKRAQSLLGGLEAPITLVKATRPGTERTLKAFLKALEMGLGRDWEEQPALVADLPDPRARQKRQFDQLVEHTQEVMREAEFARRDYWAKADGTSVATWKKSGKRYRKLMWDVIGPLAEPEMPLNPRARKVYETESVTGFEVVLDVFEDVFSYGILLVPKGIPEGERRPVVVCQHGLEGRPQHVADPTVIEPYYKLFAVRLAERGYVTFAPQNPYIGGDDFRVLQRLGNPLRLSLFSFITRQHQAILDFLKTLPYVDGKRMGFYGLSYGGKTAMRVPALLEDYCLSICSGDFDEWIMKISTVRHTYSYMRTGEYEIGEWDLGNTFNYAEMSWLICPRPFMVERGHWDGVAPDEWVGYEYAKTQNRYDLLGIGDRTEIEYFNGPHEIHAVGTFAFLDKHLGGPFESKG
ncbi:MAG: dienelactone hydrolase family protein [Armatimonadia bacterium]